jgi:hypothetical protein
MLKIIHSNSLQLLSQSTTLTNLTSLKLNCSGIEYLHHPDFWIPDSSGLIALLSSPVVKNLTHLDLGGSNVSASESFITIATSPHLSNLVSLDLSHTEPGLDAIAALAASTTLTNLTHLNLGWTYLGPEPIKQLFSPSALLTKKLQFLDLTCTSLAIAASATSTLEVVFKACPHLTELILEGNDEPGLIEADLISTHMSNLTKLHLHGCTISDEGCAAIAASLTNLRELSLRGAHLSAQGIIALVNSPTLPNLTHLDLSFTRAGPDVITAIAQSPAMSKLQHLNLDFMTESRRLKVGNTAGDEGVIALAQSTTLTNLTWLDLGLTDMGPAGVKALCTSPVVSKLTHLCLSRNINLGNSVAAALTAPSSTLYNLVELNLAETGMDAEGVLQLLKSPNLDQLDVLNIRDNNTTSSIRALYRARFDSYLCDDVWAPDYGSGSDNDDHNDEDNNNDEDDDDFVADFNENADIEHDDEDDNDQGGNEGEVYNDNECGEEDDVYDDGEVDNDIGGQSDEDNDGDDGDDGNF